MKVEYDMVLSLRKSLLETAKVADPEKVWAVTGSVYYDAKEEALLCYAIKEKAWTIVGKPCNEEKRRATVSQAVYEAQFEHDAQSAAEGLVDNFMWRYRLAYPESR